MEPSFVGTRTVPNTTASKEVRTKPVAAALMEEEGARRCANRHAFGTRTGDLAVRLDGFYRLYPIKGWIGPRKDNTKTGCTLEATLGTEEETEHG